jgi:citrate lyase subunit beta/citryl-CoA lyase
VASGADAIVLDLEDAVASDDKSSARDHVDRWLASGGGGAVRINGLKSPWYTEDVDMISAHRCPVILPKVDGVGDVHAVAHRLSDGVPIVPLIETAAGVLEATAICSAAAVVRVAFGSVDLGAELGVDPDHRDAMSFPRAMVVLASARSGLAPPVDGVCTDLSDTERLVGDADYARVLGFGGKLCIHPQQVAVVNGAFSPTEDEIRWARNIVSSSQGRSVYAYEGEMIDEPVLKRARRLLDSAAHCFSEQASPDGGP